MKDELIDAQTKVDVLEKLSKDSMTPQTLASEEHEFLQEEIENLRAQVEQLQEKPRSNLQSSSQMLELQAEIAA